MILQYDPIRKPINISSHISLGSLDHIYEEPADGLKFVKDVAERTKVFKEMIISTVGGHSEIMLGSLKQEIKGFCLDKGKLAFCWLPRGQLKLT